MFECLFIFILFVVVRSLFVAHVIRSAYRTETSSRAHFRQTRTDLDQIYRGLNWYLRDAELPRCHRNGPAMLAAPSSASVGCVYFSDKFQTPIRVAISFLLFLVFPFCPFSILKCSRNN